MVGGHDGRAFAEGTMERPAAWSVIMGDVATASTPEAHASLTSVHPPHRVAGFPECPHGPAGPWGRRRGVAARGGVSTGQRHAEAAWWRACA